MKLSRREILRGAVQAAVLYNLGAVATPLKAAPTIQPGPASSVLPAKISRRLKRSDVVSMGRARQEVYKAYGITVVDWGGGSGDHVKDAQALGIQYNAGIPMLTGFAGMLASCPDYEKAVCRDIEGKPVRVPWLWDQKYQGKTGMNFWFCSNSPLYQKYLRDLTERAMRAKPDGFHIDDYGGTTGSLWQGGCFCEHCMAGFRKYLGDHMAAAHLREAGIAAPDGFDYGRFLLEKHVKSAPEFMKKKESLPLYQEFKIYQARAAGEVVRGLQEYAEQLRGKPLVRCVNGAPPSQQAFVVMPHVDHYSCEVEQGAKEKTLAPSAAFTYKCGDMIGRGIAGTGAGWDWAYVLENKATNLVRCWIATAYACGQTFMTPSEHQWAYTQEKGTHWYRANPADTADLYQFIRKNAALFDGYEAVAQVGVLFSHPAWRKYKAMPREAAACLLEANVPFELVGAGDELLDLRLSEKDLARFEKVIVPAETLLDPAQQAVLGKATDAGKTLVWKDAATLRAAVNPWVTVEGATGVWALPRAVPGRAEAPLVVHLLNRNYDYATEAVASRANLTLRLGDPLLGGRRIKRCTAYAAGAEPAELKVETEAGGIRVSVPQLMLWRVLELA